MRYMLKFFAYLLLVLFLVIFFLPKVNLYYKAEQILQNYKLTVSAEKLTDNGFSFKINDGVVYFDDLAVAKIGEISLTSLLFYNRIDVKPFSFSKDMQQFVPLRVDNLNITYTIINPVNISIAASGEFGSLKGDISLLDKNISLLLKPSKTLLNKRVFWLRQMKKDSQGGYHYESAY